MSDEASELDKLVQVILRRHQQPTIEDAVQVLKLSDSVKSVDGLLRLHDKLRKDWWDRLDQSTWE